MQAFFIARDLGLDIFEVFKRMELCNPDSTWRWTEDKWPSEAAGNA